MRIEGLNLQIALRSPDDDGIVVGTMPFVYLLRCADGTLYVGHTHDLASRERIHNEGHGATYTESRRPVEMVYAEEHASLRSAIARERQMKRWTAKKKGTLVTGDLATLKVLSRQHERRVAFTWRDLLRLSS